MKKILIVAVLSLVAMVSANAQIAPNVSIYTAGHPVHPDSRNTGYEYGIDITIGDNVWIGTGVNILKGAVLPSGTIVGARSVVTRRFDKENCIIVGNPAKIVRDNIQWTMARKESLDRSK